ncbi:MAG TPA: histidine kinase [Prolixibacteraceae bacterium]|nr:histidine kinase [Prolixibacteraceae bacterium]HRV88836.1 histidine kinase [Prolixibacteraceae bacterium]
MYLKIALLLSVVMQVATALLAVGLIKRTRFNISWILISAALLMMAVRLVYEIPQVVDGVIVESTFGLAISWMGVAISLCLLIGIIFINKIFNKLRDADTLRNEMDRKVLDAIIKAEESERKRIAKELHDGLGPLLSNLKMSISALDCNGDHGQQEMITGMKQVANESIAAVREISNNLSPHVLENFGLMSAVKAFAGKISESKVISMDIDGNIGEKRFQSSTEVALYRVLCELINNTLIHSEASAIRMRLTLAGGYLFIHYSDNGKGLPQGGGMTGHQGMGFSNIMSRLKAIDGRIELSENGGRGFAVSITCPAVPFRSGEKESRT